MGFSKHEIQGAGIGLRSCHYQYIRENKPDVAWFEAMTDNYLIPGGMPLVVLEEIRNHYPMTFHGVGMSLGSTDPINLDYLTQLKSLIEKIQPAMVSDHLSWSGSHGQVVHDLLPLPFTEEAAKHLAERIRQVQDFLGRQVLVENISSYLTFECDEMKEWEFVNQVIESADCYLLLDVNNIYVSASNHDFSAEEYVDNVNPQRVKQIHMAGFSDEKKYLFDTHGGTISDSVWALYRKAIARFGDVPTLIERDDHIPEFDELMDEAKLAQDVLGDCKEHAIMSGM